MPLLLNLGVSLVLDLGEPVPVCPLPEQYGEASLVFRMLSCAAGREASSQEAAC